MDSFLQYLNGLVGRFVQVERGGPEACQGHLQAVHDDYVTLIDEQGAPMYLPTQHIRSVTALPTPDQPLAVTPAETNPSTFLELLQSCQDRMVRVYHAGPELCYGKLAGIGSNHLMVEAITGEATCFSLWHVRSVYLLTPEMIPDPEQLAQGR
jgi:spore coat protein B